jgi:dCMP deaminase
MPNCDIHISYMNIAYEISKRSYANRLKVGAILVKNNSIISDGYNGMPYGFENSCETNDITNIEVLHAESNAIAKIAKSNQSSENSTLYVTTSPCVECAKLLIQCGIKNVYFGIRYRNLDGVELLKKAKINVFEKDEKSNKFCEYIK